MYYIGFCDELTNKDRYFVLTVQGYLSLKDKPKDKVIVILRHDVDFYPQQIQGMAYIEKKANLSSTFYIRVRGPYDLNHYTYLFGPLTVEFNVTRELIKLYNEGFEIGLHYDDLYAAKGNMTLAIIYFRQDLALLRSIVPVTTASSHGNHSFNYANSLIFKHVELKTFNIEEESYNMTGITHYYSDADRKWMDYISLLMAANVGDVLYFNLHADWWSV
jgi:hypothetical protein